MTQTLTTIGHRTAFNNEQCPYRIVGYKRGTKDTKGTVKLVNLKQTDNAMAKNEKDKQKNNSTHDTT